MGGIILQYMPTGWEAVFYIFGVISVIWFLFWVVLCYNDPNSHPFITEKEKLFLKETIGQIERKKVCIQERSILVFANKSIRITMTISWI